MIARRSMLALAFIPLVGCAHTETAPAHFLDSLSAETTAPLSDADFTSVARGIGVEERTLQAVAEVESSRLGGFGANGKPILLFEPHIFSRETEHRFDASHPNLSYPTASSSRYPRTQDERWAQVRDAYALDADAALKATSWGMFQLLGRHFEGAGYPDVHAFVRDISRSNGAQLRAWGNWLSSQGLIDELQARDWSAFARAYNGPGQVERYATLLSEAYARHAAR